MAAANTTPGFSRVLVVGVDANHTRFRTISAYTTVTTNSSAIAWIATHDRLGISKPALVIGMLDTASTVSGTYQLAMYCIQRLKTAGGKNNRNTRMKAKIKLPKNVGLTVPDMTPYAQSPKQLVRKNK
jgi:hypothetical protein